ncbi:hypothetical protein WCP94_004520 [Bilophila wadsworthia]
MFLPPFGTCCAGEEAAIAAPDNSKQNNAAKSPQEMFLFLCAGICDLPSCQCVESGPDTRGRKGKRCGHGVIPYGCTIRSLMENRRYDPLLFLPDSLAVLPKGDGVWYQKTEV